MRFAQSAVVLVALASLAGCAAENVVKKEEPAVKQQTVPVTQPASVRPQESTTSGSAKPQESSQEKAAQSTALETVYFDFDRSEIRQDGRTVLAKDAEVLLKSIPAAKIRIEGHCDERGTDEYNLALGERRATSVAKYLTTLGVPGSRLTTISYGKERPAVKGSDEAAWSKNRRAELVVIK